MGAMRALSTATKGPSHELRGTSPTYCPMTVKSEALRQDIVAKLEENIFRRRLARRIETCETGKCGGECGALCPTGANRRFGEQLPAMRKLFLGTSDHQIHRFRLLRSTWAWGRGSLAEASLGAVSKTLRRALDSLHEPSIRAVGAINAHWRGDEWLLGAEVIISAPIGVVAASDKRDFQPATPLAVQEVDAGLQQLFEPLTCCKIYPCTEADWTSVPPKIRREYYCWLAGLESGSRVVRYGCDRHFNPLNKQSHWKPTVKKGRRYPLWLAPYQYGSHPYGCECRICTSRRY
jgi:hypothetical protein